jgi:TadE-like protein
MMSLQSIKCQRGQAVVELTFSFLIFMTIFYAIIEFSHLLYTKVNCKTRSGQPEDIWLQAERAKMEAATIFPEIK